ncbi:ADP-ribosyltransferase 5, isoform CRA_a [Mus musculus]|nr:ADP-ribosyltransferase 5, isoform CRA_a [Mus musculus]CAC50566.1 mono(ADP ribosyl)transferase [Mus musculus]
MILEDLLMVLSCLSLHALWKVRAVPILPLSLVPDTFDDAYVGCSEEMEEKAGLLLKEEMARHALLRESWEAAQEAWAHRRHKLTLPPGFKAQHGVAIMVYTNSSNTLYWELNQAVRTGGEKRHGCVSSRAVGQPEAPSTEALALQSGKTLLLDPRKLQLSRAGP